MQNLTQSRESTDAYRSARSEKDKAVEREEIHGERVPAIYSYEDEYTHTGDQAGNRLL